MEFQLTGHDVLLTGEQVDNLRGRLFMLAFSLHEGRFSEEITERIISLARADVWEILRELEKIAGLQAS